MMPTKIAVFSFSVIAAFAVGFWLGDKYIAPSVSASSKARFEAGDAELVRLRAENERLKSQLVHPAQARPPSDSSSAEDAAKSAEQASRASAAWRILAELQQRKLAAPSVTFVTGAGELTDAFATLFALDPSERANLQKAVDVATQKLEELNRQRATVTREGSDGVTIKIPSFATEGGKVYDALLAAFADTLGPDRYGSFVTLGAEQVERAMGRFGAPDKTVTIVYKPNGPHGIFEVRESFKLPQESGSGSGTYRSLREVENRIGPLVRLLPPDFAGRQ